MREYDINRKNFSRQHYEIIAKRFRVALEPYMGAGDPVGFDFVGKHVGELANAMYARNALINLALDMALRFQADNEAFEPETFLNRCSPDPDVYPLAELWQDFSTGKLVSHSTKVPE